jgi:hypothetical protein
MAAAPAKAAGAAAAGAGASGYALSRFEFRSLRVVHRHLAASQCRLHPPRPEPDTSARGASSPWLVARSREFPGSFARFVLGDELVERARQGKAEPRWPEGAEEPEARRRAVVAFFRDLVTLLREELRVEDFHLSVEPDAEAPPAAAPGERPFLARVFYGDAHHQALKTRVACLSCDLQTPVARASLLRESRFHRTWLDAKVRPSFVVTPRRHVEHLADLDETELFCFWFDGIAVLLHDAALWARASPQATPEDRVSEGGDLRWDLPLSHACLRVAGAVRAALSHARGKPRPLPQSGAPAHEGAADARRL